MVTTKNTVSAPDLFRAGRFSEAKSAYRQSLGDGRDAATVERLGDISLLENRADEALRWFDEAEALRSRVRRSWPLNAGMHAKVAMAHYRGNQFPAAARRFARAAGPLPIGPFKSLAGLGRQLALFGDAPPYTLEGPDVTRVEFVATDPLPVVELSVNDASPALFLIDTGGAEIVLDRTFAVDVGAETAGALSAEYAGRKRARTGLGRVKSIQAGAIRIGNVPIHTLDLGSFPAYFGMDIRGILGTRLLMNFLSTIDYPGGALTLRRDVPQQRGLLEAELGARTACTIPFWLADVHVILARGTLNGLPSSLFWVDTGLAAKGFLAPEVTYGSAGVAVDWSTSRSGPGGGGWVEEADVAIDRLTLGEGDRVITRHDVAGAALKKTPSILGSRLGFEIGGLISHAFFRDHPLTFDFASMNLIVG